ncbi:MAG TPA: hypothetical protein VFA96_07230 [Nocardioides sp.]|nr:hypothetical protein [Nocardioides sp.]
MGQPLCKKCSNNHYNFDPCPAPVNVGGTMGPRFGTPWGNAPRGAHVSFAPAPRLHVGRLVGPDGNDYTPPLAD